MLFTMESAPGSVTFSLLSPNILSSLFSDALHPLSSETT